MADTYNDILAILNENKAKTEAIADLERQCQNLQDSTFQHYIVIQEKDRNLAKLKLELEQNKVPQETIQMLEKGLQNLQVDGNRHQNAIQMKESELMQLQAKLDGLTAKRQEKKISDDLNRENYRHVLGNIRCKLKDLNVHSNDLEKAVDKYDSRLLYDQTEATNYERMKVEHYDMKCRLAKLDEKILESQRKYKTHTDELQKETEDLNGKLKKLQQDLYERTLQLKSVQSLLTLSKERLERIGPGCWRAAKSNSL